MSDTVVESALATSTNGGPDPLGLDPKATVLAREDSLSGKLELKGSGQVLGNFSGQIESDGDLLIGPEALWLLLLLPAWWIWRRLRRRDAIVFSGASAAAPRWPTRSRRPSRRRRSITPA